MNSVPINLEQFAQEVCAEIDVFEVAKPKAMPLPDPLLSTAERAAIEAHLDYYERSGRLFGSVPPNPPRPVVLIGGAHRSKRQKGKTQVSQERRNQQLAAIDQAVNAAKQSPLRRAICAVLTMGTKDAFDIAKLITPILVPLSFF
jgi:hypothetical protein